MTIGELAEWVIYLQKKFGNDTPISVRGKILGCGDNDRFRIEPDEPEECPSCGEYDCPGGC